MGTVRNVGPRNVSCERDDDGHRTYSIDWLIRLTDPLDGPAHILANWPLAAVGSAYSFGNDSDPWAFCIPNLNIAPFKDTQEGDPIYDYIITQKWTTRPQWRCQTASIENPLLEPVQLSGDFIHEQVMRSVDRFGNPLLHPNYQAITGPQVEEKSSRPTINITFNSAILPLATYVLLINKVNDATLWGLPPRTIKFTDARWERLMYGTCAYYYRTTYVFEFDLETFDRPIPAFGTKALRPGGSYTNPEDYEVFKVDNEATETMLDAYGRAVDNPANQKIARPQIARQGNLLLLGISSVLT